MPFRVVGFHHVSLMVRDIERAAKFYEAGLGLCRIPRPPFESVGIWYDLAGQQLHLIESADIAAAHEGHPAIEVSDIRAAVASCRDSGGTLQDDVFLREHDGSLSAFVRDPDSNLIELTHHG